MGSFSKIERMTGDKGSYELYVMLNDILFSADSYCMTDRYGSGDINITRVLHNRRFDFAMVGFLDCLRQLMEHVRARDPSIEFPHSLASLELYMLFSFANWNGGLC